jgi:hypothetical protein
VERDIAAERAEWLYEMSRYQKGERPDRPEPPKPDTPPPTPLGVGGGPQMFVPGQSV